ncbi:hypothetical protein FKF78_05210 [Aeromonas hydrophila]|nr:hypothetical protein [Aeromonas hydrophila]
MFVQLERGGEGLGTGQGDGGSDQALLKKAVVIVFSLVGRFSVGIRAILPLYVTRSVVISASSHSILA